MAIKAICVNTLLQIQIGIGVTEYYYLSCLSEYVEMTLLLTIWLYDLIFALEQPIEM